MPELLAACLRTLPIRLTLPREPPAIFSIPRPDAAGRWRRIPIDRDAASLMTDRAAPIAEAARTRFAGRFRCIGPECEDNCCSFNWRIALDRQDYSRLKAVLSGTPRERARFERGCARTSGAAGGDRIYATLQRTRQGSCVFLSAERRCSIQTAHGDAALPGVCATYPRIVTRIGGRASLTTTLSCPEAARLCLLAEDSMVLERTEPEPLDRLQQQRKVNPESRDPLVRNFLPVRAAFFELMLTRKYPVPSRLHFALNLAERLDAAKREASGRAADGRIHGILRDGLSASMLARLHRECRAVTTHGVAPIVLVQQILFALLRYQHASRLAALIDQVYAPYAGHSTGGTRTAGRSKRRGPGSAARAPELYAAYERGRRAWEAAFPDRIRGYLGNYAANFWLQEPFTRSPDVVRHVLGLMGRVAAVRFLLFMHPALRGLGPPDAADPRHAAALDRAVVEVVYPVARAVEHGKGMDALLQAAAVEHGVRAGRRALELATF